MDDVRNSILREISRLQSTKSRLLIAIDGRAASGKTTLAMSLKDSLGCNLIHLDHFFLRPEQRSEERLSRPGGNVDIERFISEVLTPIMRNVPFSYSPFDCSTQKMAEPIEVAKNDITIIEGSYSCHPELAKHYDLKIFLHIDEARQMSRIEKRNGKEVSKIFQNKWIPMEEAYFSVYDISNTCDMFFSL